MVRVVGQGFEPIQVLVLPNLAETFKKINFMNPISLKCTLILKDFSKLQFAGQCHFAKIFHSFKQCKGRSWWFWPSAINQAHRNIWGQWGFVLSQGICSHLFLVVGASHLCTLTTADPTITTFGLCMCTWGILALVGDTLQSH